MLIEKTLNSLRLTKTVALHKFTQRSLNLRKLCTFDFHP